MRCARHNQSLLCTSKLTRVVAMKLITKTKWIAAGTVLAVGLTMAAAGTPGEDSWIPFDHPAIDYYNAPLDDPITRLGKQIQSGKGKLEFVENGLGYLQSLLKA